ncbi:MAG TPA: hypothetical protein VGO84_06180 [Burkholderiales bacterium]|nr:hypothetical protein [Burkholderiales bacterium]
MCRTRSPRQRPPIPSVSTEAASNQNAPWMLVPANDKYTARIDVLKTLCERIEAAL